VITPAPATADTNDCVRIFDTTLRDGEQSPGCTMSLVEKLEVARQLSRLGVDIIEAGFPAASSGDATAVRAIADEVGAAGGPVICGLARATDADVATCLAAIRGAAQPRVHVFLATSSIHLAHKLRCSHAELIERARHAVALARAGVSDVEFSPEDATRSDPEFLLDVLAAVIEAGATTLNIPDTVAGPRGVDALPRRPRTRGREFARRRSRRRETGGVHHQRHR